MDENSWYPREMLEKRGFLKWIKALDARSIGIASAWQTIDCKKC